MSKVKMIPMSGADLKTLMDALGVTSRRQFASVCGAQPNSAAFWFKEESFPENRLKDLALGLHAQEAKGELSKDQKRAKVLLEEKLGMPIAVFAAQGSASGHDRNSALAFSSGNERKSLGTFYAPKSVLDQFSTEDLVDALQKKGWNVNLSRRETP